MTKADRIELDKRLAALDYWAQFTYVNSINHKVMTKAQVLEELRKEEG